MNATPPAPQPNDENATHGAPHSERHGVPQGATRVSSPSSETANPPPRAWSAPMAFLTTWCMPKTAAQRLAGVSLGKAYLIHLLAALATTALVMLLIAYGESSNPRSVLWGLERMLNDVLWMYHRQPWTTTGILLLIIASIEFAYALLAILVTPWGARDEPMRQSFRNAFRWTWLHTTHALPAVFVVGALACGLDHYNTKTLVLGYSVPMPPQPTAAAIMFSRPKTPQEKTEHAKATREYEEAIQKWRVLRDKRRIAHWRRYTRNPELFIVPACVLCVWWILWALLRGVGAPRPVATLARPPTCEFCGYNLSTIPMDSRCPECGRKVADSLGPHARPGPPWTQREQRGTYAAWGNTLRTTLSRPVEMGRSIRLTQTEDAHRVFLVKSLPLIFLCGPLTVMLITVFDTRSYPLTSDPDVWFVIGPVVGTIAILTALGITMLAALVVGLFHWISDGRNSPAGRPNLLAGTMQMAAYLAPYMTAWVACAGMIGAAVVLLEMYRMFGGLTQLWGIPRSILASLLWFLPNIICAVLFFRFVARGARGFRYANK